ncbi:alpha/beta fold hydrolase [Rhodococcoides fascians]|uniref:alpha/beta fold hydrolase n=1 Tax=Rhodococcoides fascians TaxID=1828 RepID=UPI002ACE12A2|nr:alpha/beta fold hydrolase [Rhodococcus fascians]WQH26549.1 alpha/beta fold hydrolase [Rhodococcus fascians]
MIDVLWLAGTFNPNGEGISDDFLKRLDPKRFRYRYVNYDADYGRNVSYGESVKAGERALLNAVTACPGAVVIGGYSQGATIAGNVAAGIHPRSAKVIGCALIADPLRNGSHPTVSNNPGGYGIGGARPLWSPVIPTFQVAAWGDPITSLPAGNYLRSIADFSEFMGRDVNAWAVNVLSKIVRGQVQPWWRWNNRRDWAEAGRWLRGYTQDGRHTNAYVTEGLTKQLADAVNREIR